MSQDHTRQDEPMTPLSKHLRNELTSKQRTDLWLGIEQRMKRTEPVRLSARLLPAFFLTVAGLVVGWFARGVSGPLEAGPLEAGPLARTTDLPAVGSLPTNSDANGVADLSHVVTPQRITGAARFADGSWLVVLSGSVTVNPTGPVLDVGRDASFRLRTVGSDAWVVRLPGYSAQSETPLVAEFEQAQNAAANVRVLYGRLAVLRGDGNRVVSAGEQYSHQSGIVTSIIARATAPYEPARDVLPLQPIEQDWATLAREGQFEAAYRQIAAQGGVLELASQSDAETRMRLVDVARNSGHGGEAMSILSGVTTDFPDRPEAALAHFTMGRTLEQQDRRSALVHYRSALSGALPTSLRDDVLGRIALTHQALGDTSSSAEYARLYLESFPSGAMASRMRELAGAP